MEINSIEWLRKAKEIGATHWHEVGMKFARAGDGHSCMMFGDSGWEIDGEHVCPSRYPKPWERFLIDFSPLEAHEAARELQYDPADVAFASDVDMVNHPPHYQSHNGVECLDAIEAALGLDGYIAYLRGQVIKYTWRLEKKWDAVEDAKKTAFYNDRLIKKLEERANDTTISN